jgi:hypothetical protein
LLLRAEHTARPQLTDSRSATLDWIAAIAAALEAAALFVFPLVGRSFAVVFRDLGGELPLLTRLAISPWFPLSLAALVGAGIAVGARTKTNAPLRRGMLVGAWVTGGLALGACLVGLYWPIFAIAGAIKPE